MIQKVPALLFLVSKKVPVGYFLRKKIRAVLFSFIQKGPFPVDCGGKKVLSPYPEKFWISISQTPSPFSLEVLCEYPLNYLFSLPHSEYAGNYSIL